MARWLTRLLVAIRSVRSGRAERELDEEIQYHLERQIDEGVKAGLAPSEARYAALRAMGAIEKSKEECRDVRRANVVGHFFADLRYARRALVRSPGFAALAIVIMALGIGANTAVFSVINGVLLKPLPYPGADRIVTFSTTYPTGDRGPLVNLANFRDWRTQSSSFEAMATYRGGDAPVSPGAAAEYGRHANVDADLFRVFAVEPVIGRLFLQEELAPGNDQPAVLISHAYWQSRFGGDSRVLEQTIRIGTSPWRIVGVLPPGFDFPNRTDIWTPQTGRGTGSRTSHSFLAVGRLKPGVSLRQAQAELTTIAARLEQQFPDTNKGRGVTLTDLHDQLVGDVRLTLYLLWGVVALVLLIACANTATLLLGKATARTREIAVRAALGASRRRIVWQLITESLLLAVVAGAFGMLLAYYGAKVLVALTPTDVIRLADTAIDGGVLAFTLAVTLATSLLFGLVPAFHASKIDLIDGLKQEGARGLTTRRAIRTRGVLVVTEIALAVVLLTGAGLLIKSLIALHGVDLGYRPEKALVMKATGVRSTPENTAFFRDAISRIALLPGVVAVGAAMVPPGDLSNSGDGAYFIDHIPEKRDRANDPSAFYNVVTPGIFAASGIPLRSGREFRDSDVAGQPMVAIVNEALVRKSFGNQDPIGRSIFCFFDTKAPMTIVGVVGSVRQRDPAVAPQPEIYMPYTQHVYNNHTLNVIIRTVGDPQPLAATVRRLAAEVSPEVPVSFTTMEATVSKRVEEPRFRALLFGLFAALAVCLAMAGVYGLMAYAVRQRSKEVALRMALGASRRDILYLILRQAFLLGAAGLVLGLAGSFAATRLLTNILFEVKPVDMPVYLGVVVLLGMVTLAAGYLPARRAAGVEPIAALKTE